MRTSTGLFRLAAMTENVASAPNHVRAFTAPMEELPRALDDMDDDEGDESRDEEEDEELEGPRDGLAAGGKGPARQAAGRDAAGSGADTACSGDDASGASGGEDSGSAEELPFGVIPIPEDGEVSGVAISVVNVVHTTGH